MSADPVGTSGRPIPLYPVPTDFKLDEADVAALIADGKLLEGEDFGIALKWRYVKGAPCEVDSQIPKQPPATGAMVGRVRSPDRTPVAGLRVFAVQLNPRVTSETTPLLAAISETDSAGRFRLQGLPPGSYYIAAGLLQSPTYYPGVASLTAARAVVIAGDAVKAGLDFNLDPIVFEDFADAKQVPMQPGSIRSTDQAVTDATKLAVRQVLQARDHRMWWAARVLELLKDGRVKVRYIGWDERFDEVVPRSRLQLDDQAIEKARRRAEWTGQRGMGPLPGVVFIPSPHTRSGSGVVQFNGEPVIANSLLNRYSLPFTSTLILTGSALVSWIVLTLFRRIRAPAEAPVVIRLKSD